MNQGSRSQSGLRPRVCQSIDLSGRPEGGMITWDLKETQAKAVVNEAEDDPAPDIVQGMLRTTIV